MHIIWNDELARCGATGPIICTFLITVMSLPHALKFGSDFLIDK